VLGHDFGKPGAWYEEGYVVLQLLRLLNEEVESVTWETRHDDGKGIDCWVLENGVRIGVQCKTRAGKWRLSDLGNARTSKGRSVLAYAYYHLKSDESCRYRFVSDSPCPDLKELIEYARVCEDAEEWWTAISKKLRDRLCSSWKPAPDQPHNRVDVHSYLRRMDLHVANQDVIDRQLTSLAKALSGGGKERLKLCLIELARSSLTDELREPTVQQVVAKAGIELEPKALEPRVHERLNALIDAFIARVSQARGFVVVPREETDRVLKAMRESPPNTAVLVHGPAGCGKSEVLLAVVERLRSAQIPTLALSHPDMDDDQIGIGADPLAALHLYAARGESVLVIDQLDQLSTIHFSRWQRSWDWLHQARRLGIRIVAGCRSVDAEKDTQLSHLLAGLHGESPVSIEVSDFDEPTVTNILAAQGIEIDDLEPPVRRLARLPICLRMMLATHAAGGSLRDLRSSVTVVDRWWHAVASLLPGIDALRAGEALDAVILRMEKDGTLSAPEDGLADGPAVEALVTAGILVRELRCQVQHLRPFHQLIGDVRIAQEWREITTSDELMQRLGSRLQQSLHKARQMRLAVPLLLEQTTGSDLLDTIVRSLKVRTLLKRSVLLGLAAVDPPPKAAVDMVRGWLNEGTLFETVLATVVRGQVGWTKALSATGWIDRKWKEGSATQRERLLGLLGAVSTRWGDGVAAHLSRWIAEEPEIIDQADRVILHGPNEDSDELFAIRLEYLAQTKGHYFRVDWKKLLLSKPHRFTKLLATTLLSQVDLEHFCKNDGDSYWSEILPSAEEVPNRIFSAETTAWADLTPWWKSLQVESFPEAEYGAIDLSDSGLSKLVELLARFLANDLTRGASNLGKLMIELPDPQRMVDGWLLLRVGACLPEGADSSIADPLAEWFTSDPRWAHLRISYQGKWNLHLARAFVARIGSLLSDKQYQHFEKWVAEYSEQWTPEKERERYQRGIQTEHLVPNYRGATAYRLLPMLQDRLSNKARALLQELQRKFEPWLPEPECPSGGVWGFVGSAIPDMAADRWSIQDWINHLADPRLPEHGGATAKWHRDPSGNIGEHTLWSLVKQLRRLSECKPNRYLPLARAFETTIPAEAREAILDGISRPTLSDRISVEHEWEPLDDNAIAEIVIKPAYLNEPVCSRKIAWIVAERPSFQWPDPVVTMIMKMAEDETRAHLERRHSMDLTTYRLNEDACVALLALEKLARHHIERRPQIVKVASGLVDHEDPGRRASAACVAMRCFEAAPESSVSVLLAVTDNPEVACERDVIWWLFWLALNEGVKQPMRAAARARLLALAHNKREQIAEHGGGAAVVLCWHGAITEKTLGEVLSIKGPVLRGAARSVAEHLSQSDLPNWLRDLTIELADNPDPEIGDIILGAFRGKAGDHLATDNYLVGRLLSTEAFKRRPKPLIDACDRHDRLLPVSEWVVAMARAVATARVDHQPQRPRWHEEAGLVNILARLVEETEREGDFATRAATLDTWDKLIDAGVLSAWTALDDRLQE
jgi:hypothetical protein